MWDKGKLHKAKGQKACPEYPQLLLDPYFKINGWIYRGILGVLVKKSLNLISFPPIPPNFGGNENLRF